MEYLLVDGYNIINAWRDIFDKENPLEDNRKMLCELLSDYQGYTDLRIVIVFDAHLVPEGKGSLINHDKIKVIFTMSNQTADNFIERYVTQQRYADKITVVTNDYLEQKTVFQKGALRMTANELRSEIFTKRKNGIANTNNSNFIIDNLDNEQKKELLRMRNDDR
ncbi:MAG: NYN domain-containing protein [Clostridiaceae bacterium]|nr:NYN domain-containing protein [Clostridiaceae bacterium]